MKDQVHTLGRLIEKTITNSVLEEKISVKVILMGSFQFQKTANDIDLILVYKNADYAAIKKLKGLITEALTNEFGLPVHYTTLSQNEYAEMGQLSLERQQVIYYSNNRG